MNTFEDRKGEAGEFGITVIIEDPLGNRRYYF